MKSKPGLITTTTVVGTLIGLMATGCGTVRAGYESAPYVVVRSDGEFELRDYPVLTVVETPMARGSNGSDGSFNRLFRYISGGNQANQKIFMTTPVFMSGGDTNANMAFVMPASMKTGEVPKPSDPSVSVRKLPEGRFAVLRYSGGRNAGKEAETLEHLRAWMKQEGLRELSLPVYAYFDPPWTPAFLRRNEVMVKIESAQPSHSRDGFTGLGGGAAPMGER
jgi:DNA gyrase inhibitor GyrI